MLQPEYYDVDLPGKLNYDPGIKVEIKKITPFEQKKFYSQMVNAANEEAQDKVFLNFVKNNRHRI